MKKKSSALSCSMEKKQLHLGIVLHEIYSALKLKGGTFLVIVELAHGLP